MYQFFVSPEAVGTDHICITGEDVNHIKNVLRMKTGEEIAVSTGQDKKEYRCSIESITQEEVLCEILFVKEADVELPCQITLFQGLPKADKMELIIQKSVELGVYSIVPVSTKRAVVKLDEKKEKNKIARWQTIAQAAAKQSKRAIIPEVSHVCGFKEAVNMAQNMAVAFIPYEMAEDMHKTRQLIRAVRPGQSIAVFIGPEGGFAQEEIEYAMENNIMPVTLGRRILRTETAGMTVLSILMYELEGREPEQE